MTWIFIAIIFIQEAVWLITVFNWRRSNASWLLLIKQGQEISDGWRTLAFDVLEKLSSEKRALVQGTVQTLTEKTNSLAQEAVTPPAEKTGTSKK